MYSTPPFDNFEVNIQNDNICQGKRQAVFWENPDKWLFSNHPPLLTG
jgi:hypothetical protein